MTLSWKPSRSLDSIFNEERGQVDDSDLRTLHLPPCAEQAVPQPSTSTIAILDSSTVDVLTDSANAAPSLLETDAQDDDGFDFNLDFFWRSDEEREEPVYEAENNVTSDEPEVCMSFHTPGFRE